MDGLVNAKTCSVPKYSKYYISLWVTGILVSVDRYSQLKEVRIEGNRIHEMSQGINVGTSRYAPLESNVIANNIISNTEIALRLNSNDLKDNTSRINNTLNQNEVSINLNSGGGGYQIGNNISLLNGATHLHVRTTDSLNYGSSLDYNLYVPDGPLFCDAFSGADRDQLTDGGKILLFETDPLDPNTDSDSARDDIDKCKSISKRMQSDLDNDGIGDACDADADAAGDEFGSDQIRSGTDRNDADGGFNSSTPEIINDGADNQSCDSSTEFTVELTEACLARSKTLVVKVVSSRGEAADLFVQG